MAKYCNQLPNALLFTVYGLGQGDTYHSVFRQKYIKLFVWFYLFGVKKPF